MKCNQILKPYSSAFESGLSINSDSTVILQNSTKNVYTFHKKYDFPLFLHYLKTK